MKASNIDIKMIKGLGDKYTTELYKNDIITIKDLFLTYPVRYDMYMPMDIFETYVSNNVCFVGKIISQITYQYHRSNLSSLKFSMNISGEIITVIVFNRKYLMKLLRPGMSLKIVGKWDYFKREMILSNIFINETKGHCEVSYPIKNIPSKIIQRSILNAYNMGARLEEYLPQIILEKYKFDDINNLLLKIHNPNNLLDAKEGQRRRKYEEILNFFIRLNYMKEKKEKLIRRPINYDISLVKEMIKTIPFELSVDQKESCNIIFTDFKQNFPMNRLLQGDVGSGKTIVAVIASYAIYTANMQVAIMVPTEILAKQHYETFKKLLLPFGVDISLLVGSLKKSERNIILSNIRLGKTNIIIGTHALFNDEVIFKDLGLVVIDEQHRFGVDARNKLVDKKPSVDTLFLSATPIPRTLGLTVFSDLKITTINTLRKDKLLPKTKIVTIDKIDEVFNRLEVEIQNKHQAYFVTSAIENDILDDRFDIEDVANLIKQRFPDTRLKTLHSKLKDNEKNLIMEEFNQGKIDVLVSTTVIEVGISVPNATMMVIMDAQNFGLAQLHQLRGRLCRGNLEGYCYLVANQLDIKRLLAIESSNDGFHLSEMDLKLRGPGDYFGMRQSGIPDFVFADFQTDFDLFIKIKKDVEKLFILKENMPDVRKYIQKIIDSTLFSAKLN